MGGVVGDVARHPSAGDRGRDHASSTAARTSTSRPSRSAFLGHFAEHDEFVSDDQRVEMEAHLRLLDKDVDFHLYPGTGHWFFEEDRPPAYDPRGRRAGLGAHRRVLP